MNTGLDKSRSVGNDAVGKPLPTALAIHDLSCFGKCALTVVLPVLSASGVSYLNPEYLVTAIKEKTGFLSTDLLKESYRIVRNEMYLSDGKTPFC